MENISYDKPCNSNKDCDSNVCELIYENNKPKGRYCLMDTNNVYTIKCKSNKDCKSGSCKPIYDNNDKFVTRKCVQAPKIDRDTAYNALFGSDRNNDYGLINSDTIAIQAGNRGPITEIIIKLFSIFGNLFNILIFNTDVCRTSTNPECNSITERRNQGLLYGIFLDIFGLIWRLTVGKIEKTTKTLNAFKASQDEPAKRTCISHTTSSAEKTMVNGYDAISWKSTCELDKLTITSIEMAIMGNDHFYHLRKLWKFPVTDEKLSEWQDLLSHTNVCDTTKSQHACPAK